MPEILQFFTIERRLYQLDAIPWTLVLAESNLNRLREHFKFKTLGQEVSPAGPVVRVTGTQGEFSWDTGIQVIDQLVLEPTVLQIQATGTSDVADTIIEGVEKVLSEIANNDHLKNAAETTRTYQSIAIVKLSIAFDRLLSTQLNRFISDVVKPKVVLPHAEPEIILERLSWSVRYKMDTTEFTYLPKTLTIEPRMATSREDMTYYTVSPTKSETHVELLRKLESLFGS